MDQHDAVLCSCLLSGAPHSSACYVAICCVLLSFVLLSFALVEFYLGDQKWKCLSGENTCKQKYKLRIWNLFIIANAAIWTDFYHLHYIWIKNYLYLFQFLLTFCIGGLYKYNEIKKWTTMKNLLPVLLQMMILENYYQNFLIYLVPSFS